MVSGWIVEQSTKSFPFGEDSEERAVVMASSTAASLERQMRIMSEEETA